MKQVQYGYHQLDEANCWFIEEKKPIYERSIQLLLAMMGGGERERARERESEESLSSLSALREECSTISVVRLYRHHLFSEKSQ